MSKKIVTLDNSSTGMVLRSPKLPAEQKPPTWRAFNQFARDAGNMRDIVEH